MKLAELPVIDALDLWSTNVRGAEVPEPADAALPYGPNTAAVRGILAAIPRIRSERALRCSLVADRLGAEHRVGGVFRLVDGRAIAAAAARSGREAESIAAFWDAGAACVEAWVDPVFPQFFWNDVFRDAVSETAQCVAAATVVAATVVAEALDEAVWRPIRMLWQAVTGVAAQPAGSGA